VSKRSDSSASRFGSSAIDMIAQLEVGYLVELGTGETLLGEFVAKFSDSQPSDERGMAVTYAKASERRNEVPALVRGLFGRHSPFCTKSIDLTMYIIRY